MMIQIRMAVYHYFELPSHTKRHVLKEIGLIENLTDDYDDLLIFKKIGELSLLNKFKEIVERERACRDH